MKSVHESHSWGAAPGGKLADFDFGILPEAFVSRKWQSHEGIDVHATALHKCYRLSALCDDPSSVTAGCKSCRVSDNEGQQQLTAARQMHSHSHNYISALEDGHRCQSSIAGCLYRRNSEGV